MANAEQEPILDLVSLSASLLAEQEVAPRARHFARFVAELVPESAVSVYALDSHDGDIRWAAKATVGQATVHQQVIAADSGLLGSLINDVAPILRSGRSIRREDYPHIDIRRTLRSLCYIPLLNGEQLSGALEILSFEAELSQDKLEALQRAAGVAGTALSSGRAYEEERHSTLTSITRVTQLYDLEKVFSSTLEMEELLPLIGVKYLEILGARAVNIWLMRPDESVELMQQSGSDPTVFKGQVLKANEGVAGTVSDNGESVCISDPEDARLLERNVAREESAVDCLLAAPILDRGALVGVVEVINKAEGTVFDEDDLFTLMSLNDTASVALHNASLMMAERKVEILETLNTVSHEITSTLNLDRMLQTIVNAPQAIIPYERAAIVLEQRGGFKLCAVTGMTEVQPDHPDIAALNEILQWAALSGEIIHVKQHGEEIEADREETKAKFQKYFEVSGMRGFYARPLNDDTGRVGLLAMESNDPDFLGPAHLEIVEVLAGQATVALRNAQMYKEVPFISVLEPIVARKRKFMAMQKRKRAALLAMCGLGLLFLVACPLPLRVSGDAMVGPVQRALVQPEVAGVIAKVYVREGDHVQLGQVLAEMEAWNYRSALAAAESRYQTAMLNMNKALAANDGTQAGVEGVQANYWQAEVERAKQLLEKTKLRSPIDGVVATPHVEDFAGRKLEQGDSFVELVNTSSAIVDVAVDDVDAGLLKAGQKAALKLNSYPTKTFHGDVVVVSPKGVLTKDGAVFYARVEVPNQQGAIHAGMEGHGKVNVRWYPSGYVFSRRLFLWLYAKLWYWLGW